MPTATPTTNPPPTVLVIEDDEDLAGVITFILAEEGYSAELVRDGTLALQLIQERRPAVILLDLHLPGVSGLDILHHVRQEAQLKDTRVLVATADEMLATSCTELADQVILKPYSVSDLLGNISRFVQAQQRQEDENGDSDSGTDSPARLELGETSPKT